MSLNQIQSGVEPRPPRILLYGYEGLGKSTAAAQLPRPIFVPTEDGLSQIDCSRFPTAKSYDEVMNDLNDLLNEQHDFQSVVVDTLTELELMIWRDVCAREGVKNIEKVGGGFGKGYVRALDWWLAFRNMLQKLNDKGMIVMMIAHVGKQTVNDPETQSYDRVAPRLNAKAEGVLSQWCDCVFQAKRKFRVAKDGENRVIAAPVGADGGDRIIRTDGSTAVIAKNRYGLPLEMLLDMKLVMEKIMEAQAPKTENQQ